VVKENLVKGTRKTLMIHKEEVNLDEKSVYREEEMNKVQAQVVQTKEMEERIKIVLIFNLNTIHKANLSTLRQVSLNFLHQAKPHSFLNSNITKISKTILIKESKKKGNEGRWKSVEELKCSITGRLKSSK
jgi:hypothetical protein